MKKNISLINGLFIVYIGYSISQTEGGVRLRGSHVDPFGGYLLILLGCACIYFFVLKKEKGSYICPSCKKIDYWDNYSDEKCPECGAELEDLKGYFDRHTEQNKPKKDENS